MRTVLALALLGLPGRARAEETYPVRPVRVVLPFAPGKPADGAGRPISDRPNRAVNTLLRDAALPVRRREPGRDPTPDLSPAQLGEMVRAEAAKWAAVVRLSGTSME